MLAFKLILTPILIGAVTLAGRRWGPVVSGLLTGLPLTSGPISLFLALQYGEKFAAQAAVGNLVGQASVCLTCLAYSLAARPGKPGWKWPACAAAAVLTFLAITAAWDAFTWALIPALIALVAVITLTARLIPHDRSALAAVRPPAWDLPARMLAATAFVVALTSFAGLLGPQLSGLLAPFPVFGLVLAVFTHQQQGPAASDRLLRGVVLGSLAFAGFFSAAGAGLAHLPLGWTYGLAALAALGLNAAGFALTR